MDEKNLSSVITLQSVAPSMRSTEAPSTDRKQREKLALEVNCFCVSLLFNGRPGKEKQISVTYGRSMNDIIDAGAVLKVSPWNNTPNDPFPSMNVFEVHGPELSGWWAELGPNVMAFLPFSGRAGLDEYDTACLLAESQYPVKMLIDWILPLLTGERFLTRDLMATVPAELVEYVGDNFRNGSRLLALTNNRGHTGKPLFSVYEHDSSIVPTDIPF